MADMEFYIRRSLCDNEVENKAFFSFEEVVTDAERSYWDIFICNNDDYSEPYDENIVFRGLNQINEQFVDLFEYVRVVLSHTVNYWVVLKYNDIEHTYKFENQDKLIQLLTDLNIKEPDFVANRLLVKIGD